MATLKDVARLACVDVSTVSRALNNTSYVHPDTKAKIYEAVKELSYQPNLMAKGLRQGKRHTLGLVVPSLSLNVFGEITQGIEQEALKLGYGVMICNTQDDPEKEAECLGRLRNGLVDGIIVTSTGKNSRLLKDIQSSGIALAQLVRAQEPSISSVVGNYFASAYEGVRYLHARGCSHIGLINGNMDLTPYLERYKGYQKAINELGLKELVSKSQVPQFDNYTDGLKGANYLLDQAPQLDGLMAAMDMQGIGILRALKERGLEVPSQVKVMSLTGHSVGSMLETAMTSMEMPALAIGQRITQMIVADIEAPKDEKPKAEHVVFESVLAERETT